MRQAAEANVRAGDLKLENTLARARFHLHVPGEMYVVRLCAVRPYLASPCGLWCW